MNGAYLHLVMNHIPVVGMPLSFLLLLMGILRKSKELTQAGFAAIMLMALITIPVFKTGGPAAHVVRDYPGIVRAQIHEHAEAADYAFSAVSIVGVGALIAFVLLWRSGSIPSWLGIVILFGAFVTSVIMGRVAHLGGLIRHPEIVSGAQPPAAVAATPASLPAH